jgi:ubiquitin carboxyl-terminal hydrolase L5
MATMDEARRNPKRKASEPAKRLDGLPSDLLEEALKPLAQAEIEEWEGWIELESEPVSWGLYSHTSRNTKGRSV